jgi:hypothetical protein
MHQWPGFFVNINETYGSTKVGEVPESVSGYQFLMKGSAPYGQLVTLAVF